MLYAILFGLDFYQSFYFTLKVFLVLISCGVVILGFFSPLIIAGRWTYLKASEDDYDRKLYRNEYMASEIMLKIVKSVWLYLFILISIFIPSKETIYIATGLYIGESVYTAYKDTPLAKKAYNLAEMKLNELLDEKLSGAENGSSKK